MNKLKRIVTVILISFCFSSGMVSAQVIWDFEDGNDHGFTLWSVEPATPAPDDPATAGDESVTGVGGTNGLPDAGHCWTIGPPNQFDGLKPAVNEGDHIVNGVLEYNDSNDPFGVYAVDPPSFTNSRGQTSYLNTYNLSQWGDGLHTSLNDQIATSPPVLLNEGAVLIVWSHGGGSVGATLAPDPETDRSDGYWERSCGIAVLSAADSSFLACVLTRHQRTLLADTLDLSAFAGQKVIIEVVDAFQGSWGWLAVDEIEITNATVTDVASKPSAKPVTYALMQNYPNPFNPKTSIQFQIPNDGHVTISVYNIIGQQVSTLVDRNMKSGMHQVAFDANKYTSGVYFYKIEAEGFSQVKKMMLLK